MRLGRQNCHQENDENWNYSRNYGRGKKGKRSHGDGNKEKGGESREKGRGGEGKIERVGR